ncbi:hypothetical protein [Enhygromyxa salina]|uniref:hypothetical protein n=1 Tax=Enhygromyxa salina TaxID=215803 RepID=UPI000D08749D|nr:hypothetical protein [Enhygromyxa salina]
MAPEPQPEPETETEPETRSPRRRPRLGIIVRALIYLPLLAFFGWQATRNFVAQRAAADDAFRASVAQWLQHPPRTIMMPNGEEMPVLELTEQEAIEMGLLPEPGDAEQAQPSPPQ